MARKLLRLAVTGGRDYDDAAYVDRVMKYYQKLAKSEFKTLVVAEGGAAGADTLVNKWCKRHGVPCATFDACWDFYGKPAGTIRNGWIVEIFSPDHGFVFPGNKGTADMRKKMEHAGLIVRTHEDF